MDGSKSQMTRTEYTAYVADVAEFMASEGIDILALSPAEDGDGYFSWSPCECCDRPQGGTRHTLVGAVVGKGPVAEYVCCSDCMYYATYGHLD